MATTKRIASLISSATEILYLLGLGEQVVGVSHECDYPADVVRKPRLTRSLVDAAASSLSIDSQVRTLATSRSALYAIDVEQLAALRPDLIVTQAQCDVCAVRYEDVVTAVRDTPGLNSAQVLALNPQSVFDVLDDVERIGQAVGGRAIENAAKVKAELLARLELIRSAGTATPVADRPRVVCLEWIEPPMTAGNWMPELVTMAGGESGLTVGDQHSPYVGWQDILDYDPQLLVIMPCGFDLERTISEAQVLAGWPGWNELSAVREGRVFAVDGNAYFNRSGPRLVDSVEILGHLFHPERFRWPSGDAARAFQRLETRGGCLVSAV
jgi:iron complex transport system substrate-binding protein